MRSLYATIRASPRSGSSAPGAGSRPARTPPARPSCGRETQPCSIDAGTGVERLVSDRSLLDGVAQLDLVLTHFHMDHVAGLAYFPGLRGAGGCPPRLWGPAATVFGLSTDEVLRRAFMPPFSDADFGLIAHDIRELGDEQAVGPFTLRTRQQRGPQHADAGAALRRPPHLLHRHALRRRQRAVRGRLARADARGVGARRLAGVDADPLLRPRRGTGRGRGGRRAARAHPPAPARRHDAVLEEARAGSPRPSWPTTGSRSSSSPAAPGSDGRPPSGPANRRRAAAVRSAANAPTRRGPRAARRPPRPRRA